MSRLNGYVFEVELSHYNPSVLNYSTNFIYYNLIMQYYFTKKQVKTINALGIYQVRVPFFAP